MPYMNEVFYQHMTKTGYSTALGQGKGFFAEKVVNPYTGKGKNVMVRSPGYNPPKPKE